MIVDGVFSTLCGKNQPSKKITVKLFMGMRMVTMEGQNYSTTTNDSFS